MYVTVVYVHVKPEHVPTSSTPCGTTTSTPSWSRATCASTSSSPVDDPTRFIAYEAYRDEASAKAHKDTAHYVACGRKWPTGWPSRPGRPLRRGFSRRSSRTEKATTMKTTMKSNGPVEAGGHRSAERSRRWPRVVRVSRSHVCRGSCSAPVDPGAGCDRPGIRVEGRWSSSAARLHRDCGLGQAAGRARIGGSGSLVAAVPGEPSPALVDENRGPPRVMALAVGPRVAPPASAPPRSTSSSDRRRQRPDTAKAVAAF